MINSVCMNPDLLSIMIIVNSIIKIIQITVPVGLVLFASFDILKSVIASNESDIY